MASSPSFLDAVGQSILKSASSIDAHIETEALVERLVGDASPDLRRARKALGELKALARRDPESVLSSQGAVPAILRLATKLIPASSEEEAEDNAEALQDALEALGCLVRVPEAGEEEGARLRAEEVAELIVRYTTNGKDLLRILGMRDISTKYDAMVLLQRVYRRLPGPIDAALLADPRALGDVMEVFQECQIDYIRNECLSLLLLLTGSNADIQKIVTFQGLVDTVFALLQEEDLSAGGKVARELLRCFANLVGNAMCQRHIRETGGINFLVSAMASAIRGHEPGEDEDDELLGGRDVPEEARWACLRLLVDSALALVGPMGRSAGGTDEEVQPELKANQDVFVRAGALGLCRHLTDVRVDLVAKLKVAELLGALEQNDLAAQQLQSYNGEEPPLLFMLTSVLLGSTTPLPLRNALGRVVGRMLSRHVSLQSFFCSSFRPELEPPPGNVLPSGRQVVEAMEDAAQGHAEPERLWFALHMVLAMLLGNTSVQTVAVSMPVTIPNEAGPAEGFLDLLRRVFSACSRACSSGFKADGEAGAGAASPSAPKGPEGAAALVATLKLLVYWMASCPVALVPFASSAVMVPLTMDLITVGASVGYFFQAQVEGLASLLMGVCIKAEDADVDVASLMALLAKRVGIEEFQQRVERFWRSEALQRPPRGLADFRWYGSRFRTFVREQQRSVQRRMVQLYVAEGVGGSGGTLSEDVADDYKQLIRVTDSQLREVRGENELLRAEVEAFMQRSLQASSFATVEKVNALQQENEALHTEVEQLTQEVDERTARFDHERQQLRASVQELEQQLQSMAVWYEQVERNSQSQVRENARLKARLESLEQAGAPAGADAERCMAAERELSAMRQHNEELRVDRAELLELLGCIVAACPGAASFVAPLGASAAVSTAGGAPACAAVSRAEPQLAAPGAA